MDESIVDVVILGTGPAGLQAAIHAARKKVAVRVLGRRHKSSLYRAHVENYCCLGPVSGEDLLNEGVEQAEQAGAVFSDEDVIGIEVKDGGFSVRLESGQTLWTRGLILAMGISRNRLGVPGEKRLQGRGVSYCVDCDANFFKGETVAIVGNESGAVSGALTLQLYAAEVFLVAERLDVSEKLEYQVLNSGVKICSGRTVKEISGEDGVEQLILDDGTVLAVTGVFIEKGAKGAVELAGNLGVALDSEKFEYIDTNKKQETNVPGIYAAGDICGPPWQVAKAVGEGCVAGMNAAKYAKQNR